MYTSLSYVQNLLRFLYHVKFTRYITNWYRLVHKIVITLTFISLNYLKKAHFRDIRISVSVLKLPSETPISLI